MYVYHCIKIFNSVQFLGIKVTNLNMKTVNVLLSITQDCMKMKSMESC